MTNVVFTNTKLAGGLEHFLFFHIFGIIIPTDEIIFFRGVGIPPTSKPTSTIHNITIDSRVIC